MKRPFLIGLLLLALTACSKQAPAPEQAQVPEQAQAPVQAPSPIPTPAQPPVPKATPRVVRDQNTAPAQFAAAFADEQHGWLTAGARLRATADGGRTWQDLYTFDSAIYGLQMLSPTTGWVGTNKSLYATHDGGKTWTSLLDSSFLYGGLHFADAETGWANPYDKGLHRTSDGGKTWTPVGNAPCPGAFFVNPDTGFCIKSIGGGAGIELKELHRSDDGGQTWRLVATTGTDGDKPGNLPWGSYLSSLFFLDANHGWLGEAKGGLMATHDGGNSWERLPGVGEVVQDLRFFTPQRGIMVLTQHYQRVSTLLKTTDGGRTWQPIYPLAPAEPQKAKLADHVWMAVGTVTDPGAILTRPDANGPWIQAGHIDLPTNSFVQAFSFSDRQHGWIAARVANTTRLYRTADGGTTWEEVATDLGLQLAQLDFVDENTAYAADFTGLFQKSSDGGRTFEPLPIQVSAFRFVSKGLGWVISGGKLRATTDGGQTWQDLTQPPGDPRTFELLPDGTALLLSGQELYLTTDGGKTWTWIDLGDVRPERIKLGQGRAWVWDSINQLYYTEDPLQRWTQLTRV